MPYLSGRPSSGAISSQRCSARHKTQGTFSILLLLGDAIIFFFSSPLSSHLFIHINTRDDAHAHTRIIIHLYLTTRIPMCFNLHFCGSNLITSLHITTVTCTWKSICLFPSPFHPPHPPPSNNYFLSLNHSFYCDAVSGQDWPSIEFRRFQSPLNALLFRSCLVFDQSHFNLCKFNYCSSCNTSKIVWLV